MMQQPPSGGVVPPHMAANQQQYHQQAAAAAAAQQQQQQQHWMMMQQQQPMAPSAGWTPQQPMPPPAAQMQHYPSQQNASSASSEARSLWIGDLQPWMDEHYLVNCFSYSGEVSGAKIIRNRLTKASEGYGFIEFTTHEAADKTLRAFNNTPMPNAGPGQNFRMNWASMGTGEKRQDDGPEYTIFVGDLPPDVTDTFLLDTFKLNYHSVKGAKVVIDRATGRSKGYGFVKFSDEGEHTRAMTEMNGQYCSTRAMRIGPAASKKAGGDQQYQRDAQPSSEAHQGENDPNNTTVFVGALDTSVNEDQLKAVFSQIGEVVHVKIPAGRQCGFVQFCNRATAEQALSVLNGTVLGGKSIRLDWGRNSSNKQTQPDQAQWNGGGYYGYQQGYEAYGYAPPAQDPNVYYGGYPGYGNYQQPGTYQQPQQ